MASKRSFVQCLWLCQFAADLRGTAPGCKALPANEPLARRIMIAIARAAFLAMLAPVIVGCDWSKLSDAETQGPNPTVPTPRWAPPPASYPAQALRRPAGGGRP